MVTLDTLLIASCISYGGGVLTTLGFGLLVALVRNTREKDDDSQFAVPLSSLVGGGPGGGPISLMDMYRASQAAQAAQGASQASDDKKKTDDKTPGGQYI